jgi:hypothetical protein
MAAAIPLKTHLRMNPALLPAAIDEILRIHALPQLASANRDERISITRSVCLLPAGASKAPSALQSVK